MKFEVQSNVFAKIAEQHTIINYSKTRLNSLIPELLKLLNTNKLTTIQF